MRNNLLKPDSSKKNFVFQFAYQFVVLVIPLIVSPYLTRTLGGTSLGIYSYTNSIAYYFVVFAMLGIDKYGQRIISQRRNDIINLRKTFWSLYAVHFIASIFALSGYLTYAFFICKSDITVAFVQTIYVASAVFDLTWLFYGLEKFKSVAIRNAFVRVISTVAIFVLVRSPSDLIIYTAIMAATTCIGQIVLFPQVVVAIPPIRVDKDNIKEHIKPLFTLFAAVVAATLYTVFDKTLLGIMMTKESVAYYEYSDKIINVAKTFMGIISMVLYPKACQFADVEDCNGMHSNLETDLTITNLIGFASCFGLLAISDQFALLYYGEEFAVCGDIIAMMSPLILIIGIGEAIRSQYIFPLKMDMTMVKILFLSAGINLVLSAILIPFWGIRGVVFGSIAAELTGFVIEVYLVRKYVSMKWIFLECMPYVIVGIVMFFVVKVVSSITGNGWLSLGVQVLIGGIVYCIGVLLYMYSFKREFLDRGFRSILRKLKL